MRQVKPSISTLLDVGNRDRWIFSNLSDRLEIQVRSDQFRKLPYGKQSRAHSNCAQRLARTDGMRAATRDREAEVLLDNDTQRHDRRTAGRAQSRSTQGGAVSDEETGITHGHAESANPQ